MTRLCLLLFYAWTVQSFAAERRPNIFISGDHASHAIKFAPVDDTLHVSDNIFRGKVRTIADHRLHEHDDPRQRGSGPAERESIIMAYNKR